MHVKELNKIDERIERFVQIRDKFPPLRQIDWKGMLLSIPRDIFPPEFGEGTQILLECLPSNMTGMNLLEIGTGSGAVSIEAIRRGANVIATDIQELACQTASENAKKNGNSFELDTRIGDGFGPIGKNELFDLIVFNAPFLNRKPRSDYEIALCDANHASLIQTIKDAPSHLKEGGKYVIAFSSLGDNQAIRKALTATENHWEISYRERNCEAEFFCYVITKDHVML